MPYRMGLDILAPLVEYTVRQKLQERRNVTLRDRCRVTQLVTTDGNGGAVSAVRLAGSDGSGETLAADLVVDASEPRRAHARYAQGDKPSGPNGKHRWHRYVTRQASSQFPRMRRLIGKASTPFQRRRKVKRGAIMFPIAGNCWILSFGGAHGDAPPGDLDGFLVFAKGLRTPTIYRAVKDAEPVGDVVRFAFPESVFGDSNTANPSHGEFCRSVKVFEVSNPLYRQGMTVRQGSLCPARSLSCRRVGERSARRSGADVFC